MAKSKSSVMELPTLGMATAEVEAPPPMAPVVEDEESRLSLSVPSFPWRTGYVRKSLDVRLTEVQAQTLRGITLGLERQEAKLVNGKCVANPVDAIRWMLENVR